MADEVPFRLEILNRMTTALEAVAIEDGYLHDLEGKVFRGRARYGENDPLPLVSIIEDPRPIDGVEASRGAQTRVTPWRLIVQGFVEDDPANPTDPAYRLAADVAKALSALRTSRDKGQYILGIKRIDDLGIASPIVRPPDDVSDKAYFWLPVTLSLVEDPANPFTSA